ncbi:MAG: hypothetical protein RMK51_03065 [Meiothermus sp.]|uniref:hypothetical protein n=1 Tax=Meiothermus sp. TaxID=1955249 RepID=UPI00298EF810|nr:hypothetical protein [Meiothermus sp.]MDW8424889.1 hypothetical protein [Meiothermus sp.]
MRAVVWAGVLVTLQFAWAQSEAEFKFVWDCKAPAEKVICLQPSGLVQFGLSQNGAAPLEPSPALGARLQVQTLQDGLEYFADLGLWYEGVVQFGLLEAYGRSSWGAFGLSLGKRRDLGGPWDDTLMGRDGRWGVFARYRPAGVPWLEVAGAYLPNAGLVGGQGFVGAGAGVFRLGAFVEVVQRPSGLGDLEPSLSLVPRLGLQGSDVELFWQLDRGFWSRAALPLPLGQVLGWVLQCPCDAETGAWLEDLNRSRVEFSLWWNPEWDYLGDNSPFLSQERFQAWLQLPRKLFLGLAYLWDDRLRLAVDVSRAPVEAMRFYLRYQWR